MRIHRRMWALGLSFALILGTFSGYSPIPRVAAASVDESEETKESLVALDENYFPDKNFREYVKKFDTDGDNYLSIAERESVSNIDCSKKAIRDLTGIGYFTELTSLWAYQNLISELDLTENIKLRSIHVNGNEKLTKIQMPEKLELTDLDVNGCALIDLDVSKYSGLTSLNCGSNQLSSLDVSGCTGLTSLSCYDNQLSSLDVSKCIILTSLSCYDNQLSSLDVSKCTELTSLSCSNNQLSSLDVNACTELTDLYCYNNQLSGLDISQCTKLTDLYARGNQIIAIDTSKNELLANLSATPSELRGVVEEQEDGSYLLDLSTKSGFQYEKFTVSNWSDADNVPQLTEKGVVWSHRPDQGTQLQLQYDLSNGSYLDGKTLDSSFRLTFSSALPDQKEVEITERNFPDAKFREYLSTNYDSDGDGKFQPGTIERLDLTDLGIQDLTGIEYFVYLNSLSCNMNKISSLDLSHNIALTYLDASYCGLRDLDVTACVNLTDLHCNDNQLSSLDLNQCLDLKVLWCGNNNLGSLDLSGCTKITELFINNQQIEVEIHKEGDSYKASSAVLLQPNLTCQYNDDILASGTKTEDAYVWTSDPLNGNLIQTIYYELPLDIRNEEYSGYYDSLVLEIKFINADIELDKTEIPIDEEHFPDPVFRKYLKNNYGNTVQAGTVTTLYLGNQNPKESIQDLTGIEYFSALYELWIDGHSSLHCMDLSKNTRLVNLYIYQTALTALYLPEDYPSNSRMDTQVTATAIEENGRYVLDLSEYGGIDEKRVTDLSGFDGTIEDGKIYWDSKEDIPVSCTYTFLTRSDYDASAEYSDQDYLYVTFRLTNNAPEQPAGQMVELTENNFKDKAFRQYLSSQYDNDHDNKINTADVTWLSLSIWEESAKAITSLEGIEKLNCLQNLYVNGLSLTQRLDLSSNMVLTSVEIWDTSLIEVNVSGCVYLEQLTINNASLTTIDLSNNKSLRSLSLSNNSLTELNISNNKRLRSLDISGNAISALDLSANTKLLVLNCYNNPRLTEIDYNALSQLRELWVDYNVTSLDVSKMIDLEVLHVSGNDLLKELDLSSNLKLRELDIYNIKPIVDFSKLTRLQRVSIYSFENYAGLEQIDFMQCPNLNSIYLEIPGLKELKLAGREQLKSVTVRSDQLKSMDLSGCISLTDLYCNNWSEQGALESLNLTGAIALKTLDCSNNQLSELNVMDCSGLQNLYCQNNNITTIDTSQNAALKYFQCSDNPIETLDLSNNRAMLTDLDCINGALTCLDVSENTILENVNLEGQNREITTEDFIVETPAEATTGSGITVEPQMVGSRKWKLKGAGQSGKVSLNLDASGNFDSSKVSNLSSGTLTETGIEWDDVSDVPKKVTYDYDISNGYKLSDKKMQVKLSIKDAPKQEDPVKPSAKPSAKPSVEPSAEPSVKPGDSTDQPGANPGNTPIPTTGTSVQQNQKVNNAVPQETANVKVPKVSKVKKLKAKAKKKAVQVSWKKLSDASGYELQYSTNKSFKKAKKVKLSKNKKKYVIKKLKSKKKYYIRIRAYKTYKNAQGKQVKAYGKYTKVKAKTK